MQEARIYINYAFPSEIRNNLQCMYYVYIILYRHKSTKLLETDKKVAQKV